MLFGPPGVTSILQEVKKVLPSSVVYQSLSLAVRHWSRWRFAEVSEPTVGREPWLLIDLWGHSALSDWRYLSLCLEDTGVHQD
jgi:hypothetical protein